MWLVALTDAAGRCLDQFHWRRLAVDMVLVAQTHSRSPLAQHKPVLGGYSMGASTALWAAYLCPTTVRGLVLLSVTTAWEIRDPRRGALIDIADNLHAQGKPDYAACVRGAAFADLPPLEALKEARLEVPTFLCAARDDPTHPAEVAERLAGVLPSAHVLITDTTEELQRVFPGALRAWMHTNFDK